MGKEISSIDYNVKSGDTLSYYGEMENGQPDGLGFAHVSNGEVFVGEFREGNPVGFVIDKSINGALVRQWRDNKPEGWGIQYVESENGRIVTFAIEFKNGVRTGRVVRFTSDGKVRKMVFKVDINENDVYFHAVQRRTRLWNWLKKQLHLKHENYPVFTLE